MTTRLKKQDRYDIVEKVLEEAIKPRQAILKAEEARLADACYLVGLDGYGKEVQAVPSGFYKECENIDVSLYKTRKDMGNTQKGESYAYCNLYSGYRENHAQERWQHDSMKMSIQRRMPDSLYFGQVDLLRTDPLAKDILALMDKWEKLRLDLRELRITTTAAVDSCSSVKKLVDNYPELAKFAPPEVQSQMLAVPHGKIAELLECTKEGDCTAAKPKAKKKAKVIEL